MIKEDSLKSKAITASLWAIVEKFSVTASQFIVGIVLARLLEPSDFGVVALTTIFVTTLNAITDGGFQCVIIQSKEISNTQLNTIFYINVAIGILLGTLLYASAPAIANFFGEVKLISILRWLSVFMPIEALGQAQRALLMKELKFKKISLNQILSSTVSGVISVFLAYYGYGIMALVASILIALLIRTSLLWFQSDWYPELKFSYSSIAHLIPSGINVMITSILLFFMQDFNSLVIGKFYASRDLGLYNRGLKFPELVTSVIQSVVIKLSLPLFSKVQDQNDELKILIRKTNTIVSLIIFPLLLTLFVNANEIVLLLLTKKWIDTVIFLKLFCAVKLLDPYINIQRDVLIAKNKSKVSFRLSLLTSCAEITAILLLAKYGLVYIVAAVLVSRVSQYLMFVWLCSRENLGSLFMNVKQLGLYILISVGVILGVQFFDQFFLDLNSYSLIQKLAANTICFGVLYSILWFIFRKEDFLFVRSLVYGTAFGKLKLLKA